MFSSILNFFLRIVLCTFTFHSAPDTPIQSNRNANIYACKRCGNLFVKEKLRNKKIK